MVQIESGSAVHFWKRESCWRKKMRAVLPFVFQKRELLAQSESYLSLSKAKLVTIEHSRHIDGRPLCRILYRFYESSLHEMLNRAPPPTIFVPKLIKCKCN